MAVGVTAEVVHLAGVRAIAPVAEEVAKTDPVMVATHRRVIVVLRPVTVVPDIADEGQPSVVRAVATTPRAQVDEVDPSVLQATAVAAPVEEDTG